MRHIKRYGSIINESVTDEQVSLKADQLKKNVWRQGELDNDFSNMLRDLKEGRAPEPGSVYTYHYRGYDYADMVKLVRKLHEAGGVLSDWFVEDHSEEFPELSEGSPNK